jgi:hypothetical protein
VSVNWSVIWAFLWPIVREALIALLMAILAILGYDKVVLPVRIQHLGELNRKGR